MEWYLFAKYLHILSATVLFGTGIGTAFQMLWAWRAGWKGGRVETLHSVASGVVVADWLFTAPAGIFQPLSGFALIWMQGYSPWEPWLMLSYAAYLLALACWLPVVRLQMRIRDLAGAALAAGTPLPEAARRAFRMWFALGWPALGALIGVFWLMLARPVLWG